MGTRAILNSILIAAAYWATSLGVDVRGSEKNALLVGCANYPAGLPIKSLRGPENDVALFERLLTYKFGFSAERIDKLTESQGASDQRPTRANIEAAFHRLAEHAVDGDQVVILLAGHGSQQPDLGDDADDLEADGFDETFLPIDIGRWSGNKQRVENAIVDDELRQWLSAIVAKGAFVWVVMDSCHSGTGIRGNETVRDVQPSELGIPDHVLAAARARARPITRGGSKDEQEFSLDIQTGTGRLVATYAAQPGERTPEDDFPKYSADAKPHGMFSFTICKVLSQATAPITYRELIQRIHTEYHELNKWEPLPLVEGAAVDREVLGQTEWPSRSTMQLLHDANGQLTVTVGELHGLTTGSKLAVFSPPGQPATKEPLGHVEVGALRTAEAVVRPCDWEGIAAREDLPDGGRCEVVYLDYGARRLKVAIEGNEPRRNEVHKQLTDRELTLIEVAADSTNADWLVRLQNNQLLLVPAAGWTQRSLGFQTGTEPATPPNAFGPKAIEPDGIDWLETSLGRISRAENLVRVVAKEQSSAVSVTPPRIDVSLDVLTGPMEKVANDIDWDKEGTVIDLVRDGHTLNEGDLVNFRITNRSAVAVDVTLLFVDSDFGIQCWYPRDKEFNRLERGEGLLSPCLAAKVIAGGLPEHMLLLAVEANGAPVSFDMLAQPDLQAAAQRGGGGNTTPLGRLLSDALFNAGEGETRGQSQTERGNVAARILSWRVVPTAKPEGEKAAGAR